MVGHTAPKSPGQGGTQVTVDDGALVEAVQAGEVSAFAALFERHHATVVRVCDTRLGDIGEAEEVAQAAFVRALERIDQCTGDRRFGGWVQTIALRLCTDHHRSHARTRVAADPIEEVGRMAPFLTAPGPGPEDAVLAGERRHHLGAVLAALPARQRRVLRERHLEGSSPAAIALAMGLSVGAVDSLLLRARRRAASSYASLAAERGAAGVGSTAITGASVGSIGLGGVARRGIAGVVDGARSVIVRGADGLALLAQPGRPRLVAGALAVAIATAPLTTGAPDPSDPPPPVVAPGLPTDTALTLPPPLPAIALPEVEVPRDEPSAPAPTVEASPATDGAAPVDEAEDPPGRVSGNVAELRTVVAASVPDEVADPVTEVGDVLPTPGALGAR